MSACHLKNQNWKRAAETADKVRLIDFRLHFLGQSCLLLRFQALAKNDSNYKAMFRKGKALGEQGFFDKALKVLEELKKKNPTGNACHCRLMKQDDSSNYAYHTDAVLVDQEIARLRAIDNEREKAHKNKMKGTLNVPCHAITPVYVCPLLQVSSIRQRRKESLFSKIQNLWRSNQVSQKKSILSELHEQHCFLLSISCLATSTLSISSIVSNILPVSSCIVAYFAYSCTCFHRFYHC